MTGSSCSSGSLLRFQALFLLFLPPLLLFGLQCISEMKTRFQKIREYAHTNRLFFCIGLSSGSITSFRSRVDWRLGGSMLSSRSRLGLFTADLTGGVWLLVAKAPAASGMPSSSSIALFFAIWASRSRSLHFVRQRRNRVSTVMKRCTMMLTSS